MYKRKKQSALMSGFPGSNTHDGECLYVEILAVLANIGDALLGSPGLPSEELRTGAPRRPLVFKFTIGLLLWEK